MITQRPVDDSTLQDNQPCQVLIIERGYNISQAACEKLHPRALFRKRPAKYYTPDTIFRGCRISRYIGLSEAGLSPSDTEALVKLPTRRRSLSSVTAGVLLLLPA